MYFDWMLNKNLITELSFITYIFRHILTTVTGFSYILNTRSQNSLTPSANKSDTPALAKCSVMRSPELSYPDGIRGEIACSVH